MTARTSQMTLEEGKRVLTIEARAIENLVTRLDDRFVEAVTLLFNCTGKVVVSGMGKSGLIGQKIAATFASTGTPAFFLDSAAAIHGDLGMLAKTDVLVAISNSGETDEIIKLLPSVKRLNLQVLALTGKMESTLAKYSDVALDVSVKEEACPLGLAPTSSTSAVLAMGDALAIALLQHRGFKEEDFLQVHPGGTLGRRLLLKVKDIMHQGEEVPSVPEQATLLETLLEMTSKKLGMTTVLDKSGKLSRVITDGDIRRTFLKHPKDWATVQAQTLGSRSPQTIRPDELAARAVQVMEQHAITSLVVTDERGNISGVLHMHDLLKNGIV